MNLRKIMCFLENNMKLVVLGVTLHGQLKSDYKMKTEGYCLP